MTPRLFPPLSLVLLLVALPATPMTAAELSADFHGAQPRVQLYMAYARFKMADYDSARAMWEAIGGAGAGEAAFNLGILYEQGLGVAANMGQALAHYRRGAETGSRAAAYQLGLIHLNHPDHGDRGQAEHWLSIAALDGDEDAAALLTSLAGDTAADPIAEVRALLARGETAQALARLQALAGKQPPDYRAVTRLAWLYETGLGVEQDIDRAGVLFRQAAVAGIAEAQYALAVMLQTGVGQIRNAQQARSWLQKAADQGYPPALDKLAESQ